jgi:TolA-binding protein
MLRHPSRFIWKFNLPTLLTGIVLGLLCLLLLRLLLTPDPAGNFFARAQRLEADGQWELALKHYDVVVQTHPESPYAPRALKQQGDILSGLARRAGDEKGFRRSLETYERLANNYPENPLAGEALLAAGTIATTDLRDTKSARRIYSAVLERYPNNQDYYSEGLLRLGRLALIEGNGKLAQSLLQRVLQRYVRFPERCAEAQYHLGVAYQTLFKNKQWARNAYEATMQRYPQSVWAGNARERLGLLVWDETRGQVPARRVMIKVAPLPDEGFASGSLLAALRLLLAARGIEAGSAVLEGWSLTPFYCGFVPSAPSHVVTAPFNEVENIAGNVGLNYTTISSKDEKSALGALQRELDLAHLPIVYNNGWTLAVGYDSDQNQVFLQNHGASFETLSVKDFSKTWQKAPPGGGNFTLLSFHTPGEHAASGPKPRVIANIDETTPTPRPTPTALPGPAMTPAFIFELKPLSTANTHRRALRNATSIMRQAGSDKTLLNVEALSAIAGELARLAVRPTEPVSPVPVPENAADDVDQSTEPLPEDPATVMPTPAPEIKIRRSPGNALPRTRSLLGWFGTPLQHWINTRRGAAAYLDSAANSLNNPALTRAAKDFRAGITALENAADAMPRADHLSDDGKELNEDARRGLEIAAREVANARDAERRAMAAMSSIR